MSIICSFGLLHGIKQLCCINLVFTADAGLPAHCARLLPPIEFRKSVRTDRLPEVVLLRTALLDEVEG